MSGHPDKSTREFTLCLFEATSFCLSAAIGNAARSSWLKRAGSSQAAMWPPVVFAELGLRPSPPAIRFDGLFEGSVGRTICFTAWASKPASNLAALINTSHRLREHLRKGASEHGRLRGLSLRGHTV